MDDLDVDESAFEITETSDARVGRWRLTVPLLIVVLVAVVVMAGVIIVLASSLLQALDGLRWALSYE